VNVPISFFLFGGLDSAATSALTYGLLAGVGFFLQSSALSSTISSFKIA
jgi:hypothetical protein